MAFFAAAEGVAAPGLRGAAGMPGVQEPGQEEAAEEDWWKCLVRFDPDTGKEKEAHLSPRVGEREGQSVSDQAHSRTHS